MSWTVNMSDEGITLILTSFFCSVNCFVYMFKIRAPSTQAKPTNWVYLNQETRCYQ